MSSLVSIAISRVGYLSGTRGFGWQLAFANPGALVITKLDDSKFLAHLGSEWVFFTVSEAIQVCTMLLNQAATERQV